jgi:hypothetical protein
MYNLFEIIIFCINSEMFDFELFEKLFDQVYNKKKLFSLIWKIIFHIHMDFHLFDEFF